MKIKTIETLAKAADPQPGDYKIEYRFAFWPKKIGNQIIWLEKYRQIFEYKKADRRIILMSSIIELRNYPAWELILEQVI